MPCISKKKRQRDRECKLMITISVTLKIINEMKEMMKYLRTKMILAKDNLQENIFRIRLKMTSKGRLKKFSK